MIQARIKNQEFSYDVKALALAFYPEHPCEVIEEPSWIGFDGYSIQLFFEDELILDCKIPAPYTKEDVKNTVYHCFEKHSGKKLLWGNLTGIRPAKIPLRMLMNGKSEAEILQSMEEQYLCHPAKARLALDVARKEYELVAEMDHKNSISLYIGIPFCPSICSYCSFSSFPYKQYEKKVDAYLEALEKEIVFVAKQFADKKISSIYIGGGTPTALSEEQFESLLAMVESHLPLEQVPEYTVEAGRPDSITEEKLQSMKNHGVDRISINPQSMKQETLDLLGRKHTVEQVEEIFHLARSMGFDNINMDLIVGLPEESLQDFKSTLQKVHELGPDSITVHTLVIKRASRMRRNQLEAGETMQEKDDEIPMMQDYAEQFCREHGYEPYYMYRQKNKAQTTRNTNQENVAYAKPGKECIYNILIMEELQTIIALGSGGSSKFVLAEDRMERVENVKSVDDYICRIDEMLERKLKQIQLEKI